MNKKSSLPYYYNICFEYSLIDLEKIKKKRIKGNDILSSDVYKVKTFQKMIALFGHKRQMTDEEIGELFRNNYPRLYRLAYSLLNDQEESKDVASGAFMELLDRHVLVRDINTYLTAVVRNRALDVLRHRQVKDDVWNNLLQEYEHSGITYDTYDDEQIKEIRLFIEKELTPQTRRVLQMCYDDKKSYKEAASELSISVQAINKHISQALRKLRERFNPSYKTN